jgi:hypothetical protein
MSESGTTSAVVKAFPPGAAATNPQPGDLILTHGTAWTSRLIRAGQRLRFVGDSHKYTWWNHVAVVVAANGDLIEALGAGVQRRNLSVYQPAEYCLVEIKATPEDQQQIVAFAETCVGLAYGLPIIASIAVSLLTGTKLSFGFEGQYICSGLAARCLERTPYLIPARERLPQFVVRDSSHTMPAHLAEFFRVEPPPPGSPKGAVPRPHVGRQAP